MSGARRAIPAPSSAGGIRRGEPATPSRAAFVPTKSFSSLHDNVLKYMTASVHLDQRGSKWGILPMQKIQDVGSAEIWRAAQHRRSEDLGRLRCRSVVDRTGPLSQRPRFALVGALTIAIVSLAAVASVSAAVHAGKATHVVLKPMESMPAVNAP
jgi:hypothetical protein